MKLTLNEIVSAVDPLNRLMDMDLPARKAFKVMRLVDELSEQVERYNKLRGELFKKYGEAVVDQDGNSTGQLQVPHEKSEEFSREHSELLQEEVEIAAPVLTFDDLEEVSIKPKDLVRLGSLLQEEE